MALRVGLTGGLASGKSTVARWLAEAGFTVVDADHLVAGLYEPGEPGARAVGQLFGERLLRADGGVDHERLAEVVFADPGARRQLEAAIHPLVRERFARLAESAGPVVVLEATLLVEAGYAPDFDYVVTVEADPELRLRRAVARGLAADSARARLAAQGDGAARRAAANRILGNDGDLLQLRQETDALIAQLRRRSGAGSAAAAAGFVLVTGNPGKLAEARRIAGPALEAVVLDLPEPQSLDMLEILEAKAAAAWQRVGRPLVVEETGLELLAMRGFPGPLVKWMLHAMGADGVARTALALGEPTAVARCMLLHFDGQTRTLAEGETRGALVLPPRGEGGFGWDPVFLPDGETRTYGELDGAVKDRISHRGRAWRMLLAKLT
jgi:dephospho-CoA kinase